MIWKLPSNHDLMKATDDDPLLEDDGDLGLIGQSLSAN